MQPLENAPDQAPKKETPALKPAWYSRRGLSTLVVIPVVVGIMSLMLLLPHDSPLKLLVFFVSLGAGVGAYVYTHPKKPSDAK